MKRSFAEANELRSANTLTLGGDIATRQVQYLIYRLTEPPASQDAFGFVFNAT